MDVNRTSISTAGRHRDLDAVSVTSRMLTALNKLHACPRRVTCMTDTRQATPMSQRSISEFRSDPRLRDFLNTYTHPDGEYAFATYDQSAIHDGPLTAADILMANLLSLRLTWQDVTPLFAATGRFESRSTTHSLKHASCPSWKTCIQIR
jgi:hypothetical protein